MHQAQFGEVKLDVKSDIKCNGRNIYIWQEYIYLTDYPV